MEFFGKAFWQSFIASTLAFLMVLALGVFLMTNYIDAKVGPMMEVVKDLKVIVETAVGQAEKLTDKATEGIGKIDDKVTNSKVWKKVFGEKEEPSTE